MKLLAIRLSWHKTPAKSLVMRGNDDVMDFATIAPAPSVVFIYARLNKNPEAPAIFGRTIDNHMWLLCVADSQGCDR
jgi:hypothetical protein